MLAAGLTLALVAAACSGDDDNSGRPRRPPTRRRRPTTRRSRPTHPSTEAPSTEPPAETTTTEPPPTITEDRAYYILPPGNYGGLPTNDDSTDQLALYDGLTPLRGDVTDADLEEFFLPEDFEPIGETFEEPTGRAGHDDHLRRVRRRPHHRRDAGRPGVRRRLGDRPRPRAADRPRPRPARGALADVPGIDAFSLVTSAQPFTPSEATEQLVTDQVQLILDTYGDEGEEIIAEAQAYADGLTAYWEANELAPAPATVNDVIATTAFIGSIFGAGGGGEARNAEFLVALQNRLGDEQGRLVWDDLMQYDDPEAPHTIEERFEYGDVHRRRRDRVGRHRRGLDHLARPARSAEGSAPEIIRQRRLRGGRRPAERDRLELADRRPDASVNDTTLAVMGPQLGYYYPEIVQQIHLSGPGIEAQGAAVPGLAMYLLIGRTEDYAWSLTSADQDVRDVFAEVLCEPDGSDADAHVGSLRVRGRVHPVRGVRRRHARRRPIRFPVSVHGPVDRHGHVGGHAGRADQQAVDVRPRRAQPRRPAGHDRRRRRHAGDFFEAADKFGFTFNWGYANRDGIGYFASGLLPVRAEGPRSAAARRSAPATTSGRASSTQDEHPHADGHPTGRLLNWNNQSAPGFMHGDSNQYGSVHRVENFDQWPDEVDLAGVVGVMNRAATEDTLSSLWPVISEVLAGGDARSDWPAEVVALLDAWVADDAPLLDADEDGDYDEAGALIFDELFGPLAEAVAGPVLGPLIDDGVDIGASARRASSTRTCARCSARPVEGPFNVAYCGAGDSTQCRGVAVGDDRRGRHGAGAELGDDPTTWLGEGRRTTFVPGLIPDDFRSTNRPTFQQVLEFAPAS